MAVYKFRIMFEDDDLIHRDVEISSTQTFSDFRQAILKAYNVTKDWDSVFHVSDDKWHKLDKVVSFTQGDNKVTPAGNQKMAKFIDDPHQRFLYIINSTVEVVLPVELLKILPDDSKTVYPRVSEVAGEFPKFLFNLLNGIKEDNKKVILDPELAEFDAKMQNLDMLEEPGDEELEDVEDTLVADTSDISDMEIEVDPEGDPESAEDPDQDAGEADFEDMISDDEI